jgi:hypothetical protein
VIIGKLHIHQRTPKKPQAPQDRERLTRIQQNTVAPLPTDRGVENIQIPAPNDEDGWNTLHDRGAALHDVRDLSRYNRVVTLETAALVEVNINRLVRAGRGTEADTRITAIVAAGGLDRVNLERDYPELVHTTFNEGDELDDSSDDGLESVLDPDYVPDNDSNVDMEDI